MMVSPQTVSTPFDPGVTLYSTSSDEAGGSAGACGNVFKFVTGDYSNVRVECANNYTTGCAEIKIDVFYV